VVSIQVLQDGRGRGTIRLALSMRFRPTAFEALGACAYLLVGAVVLALPTESPGASSTAPTAPSVIVIERQRTPVLHPVRSLVTLDRPEPPTVKSHVVQAGESLFTIADRYGVTPQTVAYNNGIERSGALVAGAALRIPTIDAAIHAVASEDTIEVVARRYGAAVQSVVETNRLVFEPDNFASGKTVLVPVRDGRFPGFRLHVNDPPRADPFARSLTRGRLQWPVAGTLTQRFAAWHTGVDIAAPYGAPVLSAEAGTVAAVGWVAVGGLSVCVRHDWGLQTCYYHLGSTSVGEGERVARGQRVGSVGLTGNSSGPHVHWEASVEGALLDPLTY
jgi:murein DD-endopeptidase MepM/ murein hydrolase activator NlpD